MSDAGEVMELEGIHPDLWLTPEGRKKAQEISDRNLSKLRPHYGSVNVPPGYVKLQVEYSDGTEDTSQQDSEASLLQ